MYEVGYPALAEHQKIHSDLLTELNLMVSRMSQHREFPDDLLSFLNDWLIKHIGEEDQKIALYAKSSEQRPIGEDIYAQYLAVSNAN
jgi:hemerythrin-like metal-binding protein